MKPPTTKLNVWAVLVSLLKDDTRFSICSLTEQPLLRVPLYLKFDLKVTSLLKRDSFSVFVLYFDWRRFSVWKQQGHLGSLCAEHSLCCVDVFDGCFEAFWRRESLSEQESDSVRIQDKLLLCNKGWFVTYVCYEKYHIICKIVLSYTQFFLEFTPK